MKRSTGPRKTADLSESVGQQLNTYAISATAAGAGMLALVQPSEAKIVYTPAHVNIVQNRGLFRFDLNHDGISDFGLSNQFRSCSSSRCTGSLNAEGEGENEIWSVRCNTNYSCAAALPRGTKVGAKGQFSKPRRLIMAVGNYEVFFGPWWSVNQAYLGIKFVIKGKTHFGWARVKFSRGQHFSITAIVTGYAYETIPEKAIIAGQTKGPDDPINDFSPNASLTSPIPDRPQPASLGALALGAQGIPWRRKESALESAL
jgi:hypothetical protein